MTRPRLTLRLHLDGSPASFACHLCGEQTQVASGPADRSPALGELVRAHSACGRAVEVPRPRGPERRGADPLEA